MDDDSHRQTMVVIQQKAHLYHVTSAEFEGYAWVLPDQQPHTRILSVGILACQGRLKSDLSAGLQPWMCVADLLVDLSLKF